MINTIVVSPNTPPLTQGATEQLALVYLIHSHSHDRGTPQREVSTDI